MSRTTKQFSDQDADQVLQYAFNDVDATISTNGFLVGKVGHQVTMAISTTTIANDTETYTFLNSGTQLYEIEVIYTDGTRETLLSATRIS